MLQPLRMILAAESEARRLHDAAREEAARTLAQAEEEARRVVRAAREQRDADARAVEERIVTAAQEQARQLTERGKVAITQLRALAEPRMEQAVAVVLRCVLSPGGRSP
jgi:cell division septum initiation protein DivIVA